MDWKYLLTSFSGRINRQPYWLAALAVGIVFSVLVYLVGAVFGTFTPTDEPGNYGMHFSPIGWVLVAILYVALLWAGIALAVKRLHDRDRSGWFYLLMLVPQVNIWIAIEIMFLRLNSPSLALRRVAARVRQGGHSVPRADVLRRFKRGLKNFSAYRALADAWAVYDNSGPTPILIEEAR